MAAAGGGAVAVAAMEPAAAVAAGGVAVAAGRQRTETGTRRVPMCSAFPSRARHLRIITPRAIEDALELPRCVCVCLVSCIFSFCVREEWGGPVGGV